MRIKENIFNVSNGISFLRFLLAIPLWFLLEYLSINYYRNIILLICIIAFISDYLDGYFARKLNQITEFGKIIDPLADKFIIGIVVIRLFLLGKIDNLIFITIVGRDLIIFIAGILLSKRIDKVPPSNMLGKITVNVIAFYLLLILLQISSDSIIVKAFYYLTILFSIVSLISYGLRAIDYFRNKNETV